LTETVYRPEAQGTYLLGKTNSEEETDAQRMSQDTPQDSDEKTVSTYDDVSVAEDGRQFIISTSGDTIFARKVAAAARAVQCLGQMSDETAQLISNTSTVVSTLGRDAQFETRPKASSKRTAGKY
jgi:dihydroxyacetone kinase